MWKIYKYVYVKQWSVYVYLGTFCMMLGGI